MLETIEVINQILVERISESNTLDYKIIEYEKENLADFIKDIIAFLNSEESYLKDKFIIFGVTNKNHIEGLKKPMRDDNEYQDLLEKIAPRPEVIIGTMKYKECKKDCNIGYIYIPGNSDRNKKRIYEVNKDYISSEKNRVSKGQSFIRKGTVNEIITNEERERIYLDTLMTGEIRKNKTNIKIASINKTEKEKYLNKSFENIIEFDSKNNDGKFIVGNSDSTFILKWYVVNNDVAHIRTGNGERIGYIDNHTEWPSNRNLNEYNYSSNDRRIEKNEAFILVNNLGKILEVRLLSADSKSHGSSKDKVKFEYKCRD